MPVRMVQVLEVWSGYDEKGTFDLPGALRGLGQEGMVPGSESRVAGTWFFPFVVGTLGRRGCLMMPKGTC